MKRKLSIMAISIGFTSILNFCLPSQAKAAGDCPINYVMMGIECNGSFDPSSGSSGGGGGYRPGIVAMSIPYLP